ncbi:MAG: polyprenyl synthetase family protein [Bacilli bacterium]|jgi:geranylgeranyl diphosphate synthase type II|nr:polyprenyl synthetase family protein [Bacilli bacterium]
MKNNLNIKEYQLAIENELKLVLKDLSFDSTLKASMIYSLLDGGKRIRPLLFLSLLDSYGIDSSKFLKIACSIEMIHTYSLVHDDLPGMDNDTLRRGKPTTHVRFNEGIAILCGDALLTDAFNVLANVDIASDKLIKLIRALSYAAGSSGMIYGQQLDLEENKSVDKKYIENVYHFKTSMMLQTSIIMAAIIADLKLDDFALIGSYLGQCFQIQDDILEVESSNIDIGKNTDSDIRNNKVTLISLLGIEQTKKILNDYFIKIDELLIKNKLNNTIFSSIINEIKNRRK